MGDSEKDGSARMVTEKWVDFQLALSDKRKYPTQEFRAFALAARRYIGQTRRDQLLHRTVVEALNGLTDFLSLERKRVPGGILHEADRLECLFFRGYDPHFEGDEPPGL